MAAYFVDSFERQLDDRGRFVLPAKVREKIGASVFVTRSPSERCLHVYPEAEWEVISEKLRSLPVTLDKNAAAFVRIFSGTAACCEIDKQGRVSVGKKHCEYAGLEKDIVLVGANTRLEIWAADEWKKYKDALSETVVLEGIKEYGLIL